MELKSGRTSLDDSAFHGARARVESFFSENDRITNAVLRRLTGLNYDQAIKFFNRAVSEGYLERRGRASGTYYVKQATRGLPR